MSTTMDNTIKEYSIETTDYQVGQDNVQKWGFDIHNPVFGISAGLVLLILSTLLIVDPSTAKEALNSVKNGIMEDFDLLFMWSANFFVIFAVLLMLSPFGKIRIGGKDATGRALHGFMVSYVVCCRYGYRPSFLGSS